VVTVSKPSLSLRTLDSGRLICRLTVASSFLSRLRGLMGRSSLAADDALYLPGTNSIHMLFMRFPIDCLFLGPESGADGARPVLAMRRSLPSWRGVVWYVRGARGVVEMAAGTIDATGVREGDLVRFESGVADQ
jgi:uncharacterized membrane protein (UPF0127 family)